MVELLEYLKRQFLNLYTTPQLSTRKRRLSRDTDDFNFKTRKLNDIKMPRTSSPYEDPFDTPSTSKSVFKKPGYRSPKPFRLRQPDVIELSDDDDVVEIQPLPRDDEDWIEAKRIKDRSFTTKRNFVQPRSNISSYIDAPRGSTASIIRKAKTALNNGNHVLSSNLYRNIDSKPSVIHDSYRFEEKNKYRALLSSTVTNSKLHQPSRVDNITSFKNPNKKSQNLTTWFKKHFEYHQNLPTILIPDDGPKSKPISVLDSDSDNEVRFDIPTKKIKPKINPVNSLKKILDTEAVMNYDWLTEWNSRYQRSTTETNKLIEEQKIKCDKFYNVNKANVKCRLDEKLKSCLHLQDIVILDEDPDVQEVPNLPELSSEQQDMIDRALILEPRNQVLNEKFCLRITRFDIQTLKGLNWLNDEVINFYVNMLAERGDGRHPKLPKVHSMNTFFYPKLISQGYSSLRRWTKKVDVFAKDLIVIPIHLGMHWCMAIIDFRNKTVKYYDSMGSENTKCLSMLLDYLREEHMDKKKKSYETDNWKTLSVRDIPQQMNGSDCGMFACMYAEFITRNCKITFSQEHMPYMRRKMVYEIITGDLLLK